MFSISSHRYTNRPSPIIQRINRRNLRRHGAATDAFKFRCRSREAQMDRQPHARNKRRRDLCRFTAACAMHAQPQVPLNNVLYGFYGWICSLWQHGNKIRTKLHFWQVRFFALLYSLSTRDDVILTYWKIGINDNINQSLENTSHKPCILPLYT